ncbi:MAG TPA: YfjI family protein [Bryobacteraceae bacterium]|nr:YfjI family protein [Bryobacteraceae bacterium]
MSEFDATQIINTLETLFEPGSVVEIRLPKTEKKTVRGYFNDFQKAAAAIRSWDGRHNVYLSLNEVNPDLLARAANRLELFADTSTGDTDIRRRRWLFIDLDPERPSNISSTDAEHAAAKERSSQIGRYLRGLGWPEPIVCDSGNGWHLLYSVNLPNDDVSKTLIARCLEALGLMFSDDAVTVDLAAATAARGTKLYGTMACKGDSTPDRPHRRSRIAHVPKAITAVPRDLLQALADIVPEPEPITRPNRYYGGAPRPEFDLEEWISRHGLPVKRVCDWKGGRKWILNPCPWSETHADNGAFIAQTSTGMIAAGCHHASCQGHTWRDLRLMYEPDAYDKPEFQGTFRPSDGQPLAAIPAHVAGMMPPSRIQVVRQLNQVEPVAISDDWDEPLSLTEGSLPDFPIQALPDIVRDHVEEAASSVQTPVDMQAMMSLACLSAVNSRRAKVQVGGASRLHEETLNLYIAVAADPGTRKSTALKTVMFPLRALEREIAQELGAEYKSKRDRWDAENKRREHMMASASKAADPGESLRYYQAADTILEDIGMNRPPSCPRLIVQDISTEKLSSLLAEQEDNCLALISAEGGIFSIIKGQYSSKGGSAPSMDIYLKAWSGESHAVDRVGSGETDLPFPLLTMGLMVQPGILRSLLETKTMSDNGFIDRFLYCIPKSLVGTRMYRDTGVHLTANYGYDKLIRSLFDLPKSVTPGNPERRFTITFSPEAVAVFAYFNNDVEGRLRPDQDLAGMPSWVSKLAGNVARIAGNLHMVTCLDTGRPWDTPISALTMANACIIGDYLIPHAKEAFGEMRSDDNASLAKRLLGWAQRRKQPHFTMRDCWNGNRSIGSKEAVDAALLKLIDHGYLRLEMTPRDPGVRGAPPKPRFAVNPAVLAP